MRRSGGQFSGPESSLQIRSLADFITTTSESLISNDAELTGVKETFSGHPHSLVGWQL
jgi:hypothetical protein